MIGNMLKSLCKGRFYICKTNTEYESDWNAASDNQLTSGNRSEWGLSSMLHCWESTRAQPRLLVKRFGGRLDRIFSNRGVRNVVAWWRCNRFAPDWCTALPSKSASGDAELEKKLPTTSNFQRINNFNWNGIQGFLRMLLLNEESAKLLRVTYRTQHPTVWCLLCTHYCSTYCTVSSAFVYPAVRCINVRYCTVVPGSNPLCLRVPGPRSKVPRFTFFSF